MQANFSLVLSHAGRAGPHGELGAAARHSLPISTSQRNDDTVRSTKSRAGNVGVYQTESFAELRGTSDDLHDSCNTLESLLRCAPAHPSNGHRM